MSVQNVAAVARVIRPLSAHLVSVVRGKMAPPHTPSTKHIVENQLPVSRWTFLARERGEGGSQNGKTIKLCNCPSLPTAVPTSDFQQMLPRNVLGS